MVGKISWMCQGAGGSTRPRLQRRTPHHVRRLPSPVWQPGKTGTGADHGHGTRRVEPPAPDPVQLRMAPPIVPRFPTDRQRGEDKLREYDLFEGWKATVIPADRNGLDELRLVRRDWIVWTMEIPPKMPEAELVSQARMLAELYERAREDGVESLRSEVLSLVREAGAA